MEATLKLSIVKFLKAKPNHMLLIRHILLIKGPKKKNPKRLVVEELKEITQANPHQKKVYITIVISYKVDIRE